MSFFIQLLKSIYEIMADNDLILRVQRVNNSYLLESCLQTCKEFDCGGRHFGSSHAAWPSTFDNFINNNQASGDYRIVFHNGGFHCRIVSTSEIIS